MIAGPSKAPAVVAARLQAQAGQALLAGDGALALSCLREAAPLVPDDTALHAALARLEMLAPPPPLPEGWEDESDDEPLDLSDDSEEEEWQRYTAVQQEASGAAAATSDEAREQQQKRAAHKMQHRAVRWIETALGGKALTTEGGSGSGFGTVLRSGVAVTTDAIQLPPPQPAFQ